MASSWSWSPSPASKDAPRVSGHSTASTAEGGVLLFGGLTGPAGSPVASILWHFDPSRGEWASITPPSCPRKRMYAASATVGDKFYIFGGWDPMDPGSGGEFLDDIWEYDIGSKTWSEVEARMPYPVSRHAAAVVNDTVIIHTFRGVLTFKDGVLAEQEVTGDAPDSLSMCAMTSLGDRVVLFGGSDKTQRMSFDLYALDTSKWEWTKLERRGDVGPPAMASASIAPLDADRCVLFGGAGLAPAGYEGGRGLVPGEDTWICTVGGEGAAWERVECDARPGGRVAASLNPLGDRFLLQGGYDPVSKETFQEPWILFRN